LAVGGKKYKRGETGFRINVDQIVAAVSSGATKPLPWGGGRGKGNTPKGGGH